MNVLFTNKLSNIQIFVPALVKTYPKINAHSYSFITELQAQLKEVKTDQVTTNCLREEMNKQAAQIQQTVQSDLSSQSEVVKELQSEVRSLAASLGEVKDMLQRVLQK